MQHRTRGEPPARLHLGTQPPRALRHVNECTPSQATHPVSGKHPLARPPAPSPGSTPRPGPVGRPSSCLRAPQRDRADGRALCRFPDEDTETQ